MTYYQALLAPQLKKEPLMATQKKAQPKKLAAARKSAVKLAVRAVNKAGFYRCGRHFKHDEDTLLTVAVRPVTKNQISVATAKKLKAERLLIVKER